MISGRIKETLKMATDKLFTSAGITTHARAGVTVTKVRYGTDHIRLIKMLSSNKKIGVSYDLDGRGDGFLDAVRVDLVELPNAMNKADALKFLATHPDFQSAENQALIAEEQEKREPKTKREPRAKKASITKSAKAGAKAIRAEKSPATAEDVLRAIGMRATTGTVTE
jgi:hypothetical protein